MPKIDVGDAEIFCEETGAGEPVMLVPGLGGAGSFWHAQVPALKNDFRVICHDHRGCGRSTPSRIEYSVDQMAGDAVRLLDALGIERAHWVGHSTGGAMGQIVAQDYPDRLGALVLSATWAGRDGYFRRAFAARKAVLDALGMAEYARHSLLSLHPPWYVARNEELMAAQENFVAGAGQPAEIMASRIDAICAFDRRDRLGDIAAPTLVIVAEDDMVTPRYLSDEIAEAVPGAEKAILPTGGHFVPHILIDDYNAAIGDFLRRNRMDDG